MPTRRACGRPSRCRAGARSPPPCTRPGRHIFAQLWHVGRISDPMFLDGQLPVAPSALAARGHRHRASAARLRDAARARQELPGVIQAYRLGRADGAGSGFRRRGSACGQRLPGPVPANEGFTRESAEAAIAAGRADAVALACSTSPIRTWARALKAPLNRPTATFYAPGPGATRTIRRWPEAGAPGAWRVRAVGCGASECRAHGIGVQAEVRGVPAPGAPAPPPPGRRGGRPGRRRPRQARQQHPLPAAGIVRQAEQRGRAQQCGIGAPAARAPQPAQPFLDIATEQRFFRQRHQQGIVDQPQPAVVRPFGAQPTMPSASASVRHTRRRRAPQASVARSVRPASRPIMTGGRARMIQNATRGLSRFRYMLNGTASGLSARAGSPADCGIPASGAGTAPPPRR